MRSLLQKSLDELQTGIELTTVNLKDIHPPLLVAGSFEEVIAGYQEKQKIINDALGYQNKVVPESRGNSVAKIEAARSYIIDRVKKAEGKAVRFRAALPATEKEKQMAKARIRLRTLHEVLKEKTKIIVDPKAGKPEIWMDFKSPVPTDLMGGNQ